jgi:hypothetical protein
MNHEYDYIRLLAGLIEQTSSVIMESALKKVHQDDFSSVIAPRNAVFRRGG